MLVSCPSQYFVLWSVNFSFFDDRALCENRQVRGKEGERSDSEHLYSYRKAVALMQSNAAFLWCEAEKAGEASTTRWRWMCFWKMNLASLILRRFLWSNSLLLWNWKVSCLKTNNYSVIVLWDVAEEKIAHKSKHCSYPFRVCMLTAHRAGQLPVQEEWDKQHFCAGW